MDPRDQDPRRQGSFAALSATATKAAEVGRQLVKVIPWPRWWFWPLVLAAGAGLVFLVGWL